MAPLNGKSGPSATPPPAQAMNASVAALMAKAKAIQQREEAEKARKAQKEASKAAPKPANKKKKELSPAEKKNRERSLVFRRAWAWTAGFYGWLL